MSLEALLHCIDSIKALVEGEERADFQHCSNHRRCDPRCGEELHLVICNSSTYA